MTRLAALLLAGTTIAAASPAYALREPAPSRFDPHVGHVPYNADDVVHLPAEVGREITVVLSPSENIPAGNVAVSDKADLRALPAANVLFLKPVRAMDPQPITVRAILPDGSARIHVFQFEAHEPGSGPCFYKIQVDYPREDALARVAAWRQRRQEAAERHASEQLRTPGSAFALNKQYVGQGDASILPTREMWDDGQFTYVRLPGHARIPGFWAVNPDGKPALVSDFNKVGDIVSLPRTASAWHLRDGDAVLYVWNLAYNPVGNDTGTGTASPAIERNSEAAAGARRVRIGSGSKPVSETEYPDVPERRSFVSAISAVAGGRRPLSGKQVVGLLAGAVVVYFAVQGVRHMIHVPLPEPKPKMDASADGGSRPFTPPPNPPMPGVQNAMFQQPGAPPMPATNQTAAIYDRLNGKREKTPEELARESDIGMGGPGAGQVSGSPVPRPSDPNAPAGSQTDLARSLQPTEVSASVAHVIPHPDFTVSEGAVIPCTNLTPLSSGQAVFVTAELPADVWGMTHKVRLIDAGATITGEIRMANAVTPGQNRIPVLWRNITTKGEHPIRIAVNSPAGDELGLGGLQGTVISHWLRRIGGALLYTGIQSGAQLGTAALLSGRGGGSSIYSLGNGVGQDIGAEALRENANIPDEVRRDQGLSCSVLLGRDLDFSGVYGLRPVSSGPPRPLDVVQERPRR